MESVRLVIWDTVFDAAPDTLEAQSQRVVENDKSMDSIVMG